MNEIIVIIIALYFFYYLFYKYLKESSIHYLFWLFLNGLLVIGLGFMIHFSKRIFYMIETVGVLYLLLVAFTVLLHYDVIEKYKDHFK